LLIALFALASTALLTAACGDDDDSGGTATATHTAAAATSPAASPTGTSAAGEPLDLTITAHDFAFDKTSITAQVGQTVNVTFNNTGNTEHSFTVGDTDVTEAEGGDEGNGSFTASASTVEFHCKYHPTTMKGTITIEGASSANLSPTNTGGAALGGMGY
jgi:plastocyanin